MQEFQMTGQHYTVMVGLKILAGTKYMSVRTVSVQVSWHALGKNEKNITFFVHS